ncbi:MAG: hypothetical protein K1W41_25420 [Lachnospiraceae bacterium]
MVTKKRISISITPDTEERLKQYAYENHKSVSQSITDWIWGEKVKNETIRGQQSMEIIKPPKKKAAPEQTEKPKRQSRGRKPKTEKQAEDEN